MTTECNCCTSSSNVACNIAAFNSEEEVVMLYFETN